MNNIHCSIHIYLLKLFVWEQDNSYLDAVYIQELMSINTRINEYSLLLQSYVVNIIIHVGKYQN